MQQANLDKFFTTAKLGMSTSTPATQNRSASVDITPPSESLTSSYTAESTGSSHVVKKLPHPEMDNFSWKGQPLENLRPWDPPLQSLRGEYMHKIFFDWAVNIHKPHIPYPAYFVDKWDDNFVRMPCSSRSLYPVKDNDQKSLIVRWTIIENALRKPMRTSQDLSRAILSYNSRFQSMWNFNVLHHLCNENLMPNMSVDQFFSSLLPALCAIALNLPIDLTRPIPLLRRGTELSLTLSQLQVASLLANAFFSTFPRRNSLGKNSEYSNFPAINFSRLMSVSDTSQMSNATVRKREKLRCLIHYFHRVTRTLPTGTVTYSRRRLHGYIPDWPRCNISFDRLKIHISATGNIEEAGENTMQVDFANAYLGGGVLNAGCVQEEILFVLRPELLAACLFVERLDDDEAVVIEGAERYSTYSGYADNFKWTGDFNESQANVRRDKWGRIKTTVIAIDALDFSNKQNQYRSSSIRRELNKAYCGFQNFMGRPLPKLVATGNWGCGAFGGDVRLKFLIQLMACCQANKNMVYYTFGDRALCADLYDMYTFLSTNEIPIGALWNVLATLDGASPEVTDQLFVYIKDRLSEPDV